MKQKDLTIFEYRLAKEIKYTDLVRKERSLGRSEKVSFPVETAGFVDGYIYRPKNAQNEVLPAVFNFHGGGMVLGYCEQDGRYCQKMADEAHAAVINVDYPLAPEYKYPIPVEASFSFIVQMMEHAEEYNLKKEKIQLMGHSAGGYLAAALCVMNGTEKKMNISSLIMNYPILRRDQERKAKDPSKAISEDRMTQYFNWYFDDPAKAKEPCASPLYADENVFPKVLVNAAEYDSLCDEAAEFAQKLTEAGKKAECFVYPECMHGFTHDCFSEYDKAQAELAWKRIAEFLKENE